jgi:hypothetical protein
MFELLFSADFEPASMCVDGFLQTYLPDEAQESDYATAVEAFLYGLPRTVFELAYEDLWNYQSFDGYLGVRMFTRREPLFVG